MNILIVYENYEMQFDEDTESIYSCLHYINEHEPINISQIALDMEFASYLDYIECIKEENSAYKNSCTSKLKGIDNLTYMLKKISENDLLIVVTSPNNYSHAKLQNLFETLSYICLPHHKTKFNMTNVVAAIVCSDFTLNSQKIYHALNSSLCLSGVKDILSFNLQWSKKAFLMGNSTYLTSISKRLFFCVKNKKNHMLLYKKISNYLYINFNSLKYFLSALFSLKKINYSTAKNYL